jgi:gliding motility-associated-like protein
LTTGNNIISYSWSNNLGNTAGPFVVSPNTNTTYSVTITNICGASAASAATVAVHPLPQINIPPQSARSCDLVTLQFSDTCSANNGSSYMWNFGDGTFSQQQDPSHTYTQSGNYTVGVTVTSPYGCSSSVHAICSVTVVTSPRADFTSDPGMETSIINPNFRFFDQSGGATIWNWSFGDNTFSILQNPVHTYAQTGIYTVKLVALNNDGCVDSVLKTIEVKPEFTFYVPDAFTPNGDHLNDIFNGKGIEITEFEMMIFDRWGNQIFKTNDLNEGWDGRANNGIGIAQEDVYVYKIRLKDFEKKEHDYTGRVSLLK